MDPKDAAGGLVVTLSSLPVYPPQQGFTPLLSSRRSDSFSSSSASSERELVNEKLAARRRPGAAGPGGYDALPSYVPYPDSPNPGAKYQGSQRAWFNARPKTVGTLVLVGVVTLLLLPASNRDLAQSALDTAGVSLPDRLREFFDHWDFGGADSEYDGSQTWSPVPSELEGLGLTLDTIKPELPESPHVFHPNGQFFVKPLADFEEAPAPHPILTLIERANSEWAKKVSRQSRTLADCAAEYRRRYKRNPPKGFDKWWWYAQKNKIVLTDEYDQIYRDLEPFWAIEPSDLVYRSEIMSQREESFTIQILDGKLDIHGPEKTLRRAKDLGDIMSRFANFVPDANFTFTKHDQPAVAMPWAQKEKLAELSQMGEYFGPSDWGGYTGNPRLTNWANGCPEDSELVQTELKALVEESERGGLLWKSELNSYKTELSKERSFIYDHVAAMNLCQHPEVIPLHGFTMAPGTDHGPLVPLFTFAKTNIHSDVLVTPLEQYSDTYIGYDPDWSKKPHNKLMWRGSTTGVNFDVENDWQESQRARLHFKTHESTGTANLLWAEADGPINEKVAEVKTLNEQYMDCSFAGGPVQCDAETCEYMAKNIDFAPTMGLDDSYQYKYVMDVDGNGWSGRFHRLMSMKACTLKSTLFPEWYSDRIQPWVHYVPVKVDYTDLYDILTFFQGTPDGVGGHEHLAEKIGLAGKMWARDHWRKQDMTAYMFRLALEWSRLLHRDDPEPQDWWEEA